MLTEEAAKATDQGQEEITEGGMNQPLSAMFFSKQRTTRIKKLCPCIYLQTTWHRTFWSRKAEIPNLRFLKGVCQTNHLKFSTITALR